jgi:hypothetical protein
VSGESRLELSVEQAVARTIQGLIETILALHLAQGNYVSLSVRSPSPGSPTRCRRRGGLGVHLALDLAGQARFGPDVEWADAIDYGVEPLARAATGRLWAQIEHLDAGGGSFETLCGSNLPTRCQLGEQRHVSAMPADQDW